MAMNEVEHVVLLMLENRSFDSMLGWLYENKKPLSNTPPLKPSESAYHGLQEITPSAYANEDQTRNIKVLPTRGAEGLGVPNVNPGESFEHVTRQLFGTTKAGPGDKPTMRGYVRDYAELLASQGKDAAAVKRYAGQVMQSYTPAQLPVLNGLAEHYAVCDLWFSSVPSQTNTNRAFALCGTSMGLVDNGFLEDATNLALKALEKVSGELIGDDRFRARTIFNALHDAGLTWSVVRQSGYLPINFNMLAVAIEGVLLAAPGNLISRATVGMVMEYLRSLSSSEVSADYTYRLFPEIGKIPNANAHFSTLDSFLVSARQGRLPHFTYIEPEWTIAHQGTGNSAVSLSTYLFHQGNDYHPPGNLDAGENLLKKIYSSLIANTEAWEKTLLIITFDEPVGTFDHVPPPPAIPPWGTGTPAFERQHDFNFDRYGARVPAILVSPRIAKGTVFRSPGSIPFDHTSIIATLLEWRGLSKAAEDFGQRTANAPTFTNLVSLATPRTDASDLAFLKLARKRGEPVHFYDRFRLRNAQGQYVSRFLEHYVVPFSKDDPAATEYFPTTSYEAPVTFYCQNAAHRPDEGVILGTGSEDTIKLISSEEGLGSYNVLGNWKNSSDCYYFNDYMEGEYDRQQTWAISKLSPASGPLCFGDKVFLVNGGERLNSRYNALYGHCYLCTDRDGSAWSVEPVVDGLPVEGALKYGDEVFLKHLKTNRYISAFKSQWGQWKPTLGQANKVRLKLSLPDNAGYASTTQGFVADGACVALVSSREDLTSKGTRCDHLFSGSRTDLYYYYADFAPRSSTWRLSTADGAPLRNGSTVYIVNDDTQQVIVPEGEFMTTRISAADDALWMIEGVPEK